MGAASSLYGLSVEQALEQAARYFHDQGLDVVTAFRMIDEDGSDFINFPEFRRAVHICFDGLHLDLRDDELQRVFSRFDTNFDGKLSLQEFNACFMGKLQFAAGSAGGFVASPGYHANSYQGGGFEGHYDAMPVRQPVHAPSSEEGLTSRTVGRIATSIVRTGWTPQQIFDKLDGDRNGSLSRHELEDVVLRFQPDLSLSERDRIFRHFDRDGSGQISLYEFCRALEATSPEALAALEGQVRILAERFAAQGYTLRQAWQLFDRDGDQHLTADEWRRAVRALAPGLRPEDGEAILKHFDRDGNGLLSIVEFQEFYEQAMQRTQVLAPDASRGLPARHAMPCEEPWQTDVLDLVRNSLCRARAGMTIQEVFRRMDISRSGNLTRYEFDRMVSQFRPDLNGAHMESLFHIVNTSGSGAITLNEFNCRFG